MSGDTAISGSTTQRIRFLFAKTRWRALLQSFMSSAMKH
jgi:hypothetical protein